MTSPKSIPDASLAMIERLAARVRAARLALGIPRRELSLRSGVSQRYLAQLEAGEGNISILLLHRVAMALNVNIEELLAEPPALDGDVARVAQLFCAAPTTVQGRVRALLAPQSPAKMRAQRVCLIGLRGSGTSTLGKLAADQLKVPFVELEDEVADQAGMPVSEVMALHGDDGYRAFEAQALARVIERYDKMVLAVSSGTVAQSAPFERALERFHTIWVCADPAGHMARARCGSRHLESSPVAMDQPKIDLIDAARHHKGALGRVDTSNTPVTSSVTEVLAIIAKGGFMASIGAEG